MAVALLALAQMCLPLESAAQVPVLQPGLRLRVDARPFLRKPIFGTIMAQSAESLTVATSGTSWHRIPSSAVRQIHVAAGQSRMSGAGAGMAWGLLSVGALTLAIAGPNARDPEFIIMGFAGIGGFIGALTGYAIGGEEWSRVYPPVFEAVAEIDRLGIRRR